MREGQGAAGSVADVQQALISAVELLEEVAREPTC
jgi:hypothetical protein